MAVSSGENFFFSLTKKGSANLPNFSIPIGRWASDPCFLPGNDAYIGNTLQCWCDLMFLTQPFGTAPDSCSTQVIFIQLSGHALPRDLS